MWRNNKPPRLEFDSDLSRSCRFSACNGWTDVPSLRKDIKHQNKDAQQNRTEKTTETGEEMDITEQRVEIKKIRNSFHLVAPSGNPEQTPGTANGCAAESLDTRQSNHTR
jgi:hypothetical protein